MCHLVWNTTKLSLKFSCTFYLSTPEHIFLMYEYAFKQVRNNGTCCFTVAHHPVSISIPLVRSFNTARMFQLPLSLALAIPIRLSHPKTTTTQQTPLHKLELESPYTIGNELWSKQTQCSSHGTACDWVRRRVQFESAARVNAFLGFIFRSSVPIRTH